MQRSPRQAGPVYSAGHSHGTLGSYWEDTNKFVRSPEACKTWTHSSLIQRTILRLRSFLTLSSLFLQLSELVEQLKAQLELEEVSDNPDNIATVLTNLKHQGEATLDSIHTAIDEGETIIEELKLASSEGVDSSSLQHVEKVIKELDRVRRAIEHSWTRRRQQLELWLQLREFERSAKLVFITVD